MESNRIFDDNKSSSSSTAPRGFSAVETIMRLEGFTEHEPIFGSKTTSVEVNETPGGRTITKIETIESPPVEERKVDDMLFARKTPPPFQTGAGTEAGTE